MIRILTFPGSINILDFCWSMNEWLAIYVSVDVLKVF